MTTFQLGVLVRVQDGVTPARLPFAEDGQISGVAVFRPPGALVIWEGPASELTTAFEKICGDDRFDDPQCILFRPAAKRAFAGQVTKVIDHSRSVDAPRPIDLWAALNLDHPSGASEEAMQIRDAIGWFSGGAVTSHDSSNGAIVGRAAAPLQMVEHL